MVQVLYTILDKRHFCFALPTFPSLKCDGKKFSFARLPHWAGSIEGLTSKWRHQQKADFAPKMWVRPFLVTMICLIGSSYSLKAWWLFERYSSDNVIDPIGWLCWWWWRWWDWSDGWGGAWMIYAGLDVFITSPRDPVIDFHKSPAQNSPLLSGLVEQSSRRRGCF